MPGNDKEEPTVRSGAGAGVDIFGGPVVDPTKNVLDLVKAESKYQDAMRDSSEKFQNAIRDAENRRLQAENRRLEELHNAENKRLRDLAEAETRRVDGLDEQRVRYETRIAEDLRVNVKTTSDQLAGQLIKETGALYNQITTLTTSMTNQVTTLATSVTNQISGISTGINTRLADLERFRWETGGKSAVADPALTLALSEMTKSISALKDLSTRSTGQKEENLENKRSLDSSTKTIIGIVGAGISLGLFALAIVQFVLLHHNP
jgi:hypothetical protein